MPNNPPLFDPSECTCPYPNAVNPLTGNHFEGCKHYPIAFWLLNGYRPDCENAVAFAINDGIRRDGLDKEAAALAYQCTVEDIEAARSCPGGNPF